ncbi:hypothetical protein BGZ63DRAFT_456448 [Mariannaea sp. PMI_226]|nr:hypothetical protein BGZ63DRAFT_456448 [Mariannaea sp. PMI_226]
MFAVGTSPLEIGKYAQLLYKIIKFFKKGAVTTYMEYLQVYKDFRKEAKLLKQHAKNDKYLQERLRVTKKLLHEFSHSIKELSPYLDKARNRGRPSRLKTFVAKLKWANRAEQVEDLQKTLEKHFNHFMRLRFHIIGALMLGVRLPAPPKLLEIGPHFRFETASREVYSLPLSKITSLEDLHEWLLDVFDRYEAGRKFIEDKSYVLRNTNTNRDILPSGPCASPFPDLISKDHRVEMSIVVTNSHVSQRTKTCPKCETTGNQWDRHKTEVTCSKCGLCIRFLSRSSTVPDPLQPDPLTKVALDDIRAKGIGEFFKSQSFRLPKCSTAVDMECWLESKISETSSYAGPYPCTENNRIASDPWVFRRVVVCNTQWPADSSWSNIERAETSMSDTINTLKNWIEKIDAGHGLVGYRLGRGIGFEACDPVSGDEDLLRQAAERYDHRQPRLKRTSTLRQRFGIEEETFTNQFLPAVVLLRCLLWLYADILSVEAKVLRACSVALDACAPERGFTEYDKVEETLSFFVIPPVVLGRIRVIPIDVARAFRIPRPRYIPAAICQLVARSRDLSIHYHLNGNLKQIALNLLPYCFFRETLATGNKEKDIWRETFRDTLESIIESGGMDMLLNGVERVCLS